MPSTINGIGTHYYGKKNPQSRPAVCTICHKPAELQSYDTRLWFVVVFIPVIPLGRKRIIDYCPHCTRHRIMPLSEWDKLKAERLREATELMKNKPNDGEAAVKLHGNLVAFGQMEEADRLAAVMRQRFANDAKTQAYLGSAMDYVGRGAEALPYYQRALELDPALPEARVAVGLDLVRQGKPWEAHKLLKFLEAPEAQPHPGALFALAEGYQKAGEHEEALKLFRLLSTRFPALVQDKVFRKAVQTSERALGPGASQLPPRKLNLKPLRGWAIAAAVILMLVFGSNFFIAHNRTLYIVSGLNQRVEVEIKGIGSVPFHKPGMWTMTVPEGRHQAILRGALSQTMDFEIKSDFFGRWFDKPAYILNAGGSALLILEHMVYVAAPASGGSEADYQLHFGQPFLALQNIDYLFAPFPEKVRLDSHAHQVRKSRVGLLPVSAENAFYVLTQNGKFDQALSLAEWHLGLHPEATGLLPAYVTLAQAKKRDAQMNALLAEGIKRQPIEIQWHRFYQGLHMTKEKLPALVREYDALLAANPTNSALLYLRGRLAEDARQSTVLFQRALQADPKNAYAHFALAHRRISEGDWAAARPHLAAAVAARPDDEQFQEVWFNTRLALQEYPTLETELRKALKEKPLNIDLNLKLCEVLIASVRAEEARNIGNAYEQEARRRFSKDNANFTFDFRQGLLYALGDFAALEKLLAGGKKDDLQYARFKVLLESGKLQAAEALYPLDSQEVNDPYHFLVFGMAWTQAGDLVKGVLYRDKGVRLLQKATPTEQAVAELLERTRPPEPAQTAGISLDAAHKAIVLAALGQKFSDRRAEFFGAARRLNVRRVYPYHLIERLTGGGKPAFQLLSE